MDMYVAFIPYLWQRSYVMVAKAYFATAQWLQVQSQV